MKKQRIGAWLLAVLMLLGSAAGCTGGQDSKADSSKGESSAAESSKAEESSAEADSIFNAPGELPIVKEPVTLSIFAPSNGEYSWAENTETLELEDKTGIHLDWTIASSSDDVYDKFSVMFASHTMTDIMLVGVGSRYDKANEAMFGAQGLVLPLNEYLDTVSVGYKAAFEELDGMREFITTPAL